MPRAPVPPERIRASRAAEMLGISLPAVQVMARNGDIPGAAKLGGSWTFNIKALTKFKPEFDEARAAAKVPKVEPPPQDTVYVVRCGYRVKIGFTKHLARRLYTLQTGNHRDLVLLVSFPAPVEVEKALHKRFADLHVRGEWYKLQKPIKEWLRDEHGVSV